MGYIRCLYPYPESVEEMIPDYLQEVPYTHQGFEIFYKYGHPIWIYEVYFYPNWNQYCSYIRGEDLQECGFYDPTHSNNGE